MPQGKYENARYKVIARELKDRIRGGEILKGNEFFTREELAEHYGISPLTAYHVLKQLESEGVLECGRGHRAKLVAGLPGGSSAPDGKHKIAIFCRTCGPGTPSICIEWLINYFRNRLRNDNQEFILRDSQKLVLPDSVQFDAAIVLLERENNLEGYDWFRKKGIPFSMISFSHAAENILFILPQLFLGQLMLYLMQRDVRKVVFVHGIETPLERLFRRPAEQIFPDLSRDIEFSHEGPFSLAISDDRLKIEQMIDRPGNRTVKTAYLCANRMIADFLRKKADVRGWTGNGDFIMAGVSAVMQENMTYPIFDLKIPDLGLAMIEMLYRQIRTGRVRDPGAIHMPEFRVPSALF